MEKTQFGKTTKHHNVYGGLWFRIRVSEDIETEISLFTRIRKLQIFEFLLTPETEIELFRSEQSKYHNVNQ